MMKGFIIGVDEVGRGPLAGPVIVTALAMPTGLRGQFKDSKKLSAKQRRRWSAWIKNQPEIVYASASVFPSTIDRLNIARAANLAATRALLKLLTTGHLGLATSVKVMLDGGLYVNVQKLVANGYTLNPRTIVRGDEKYNAIKLASIVAKVKRDGLMERYHKKYPIYGFNEHKGYGTKRHRRTIRKHGPSKIHRLTFLKNCLNIMS